jgi:hypothetical protein
MPPNGQSRAQVQHLERIRDLLAGCSGERQDRARRHGVADAEQIGTQANDAQVGKLLEQIPDGLWLGYGCKLRSGNLVRPAWLALEEGRGASAGPSSSLG